MNGSILKRRVLAAAIGLILPISANPALAGPDDDAVYKADGVTLNQITPVQDADGFADFPTNIDTATGLRIMPPTESTFFTGQRFDLRIENQIPCSGPPTLKWLVVNGVDMASNFLTKIAKQDTSDPSLQESGRKGLSPNLYGNTVRNIALLSPGLYKTTATVVCDGVPRTVTNVYRVSPMKFDGGLRRVAFFLGDGMGQPLRTAARIYSKGVFEGRAQGQLNYDQADEIALIRTASYDSIITDSAPGMANYLTGVKQPNNALNVSADNTPDNLLDNPRVETIMEFLKRTQGWAIGVVSDAYIVDATPGSAQSHNRARSQRDNIAQQFIGYFKDGTAQPKTGFASLEALNQPLDVILGAGARYFVGNGTDVNPANGVSDLDEFWQDGSSGRSASEEDLFHDVAPLLGYTTVRTAAAMVAAPNNRPLLGIFGGDGRASQSALDDRNIPNVLDRLVARGDATIGGRDAFDPALGLQDAPDHGNACGATVQECFNDIPTKSEMVAKAMQVLEARSDGRGWFLLIEQSHSDKMAHPLELERTVYEVIELDNALGAVRDKLNDSGLIIVTADHAQPESIIGVVLPDAIAAGGATPPGGCFSVDGGDGSESGGRYPITLNADLDDDRRPCPLQDVIGTFNDGTFPTYADKNGDNFPDDPDPSVKLIVEQAGRPTYSQNFLTNPIPLSPTTSFAANLSDQNGSAALPNPLRDPGGLLLTGNMPTPAARNTVDDSADGPAAGSAAKGGNVSVAPHSTDDVPLLAYGNYAGVFGGVYENTEVSIRLAGALSGQRSSREFKSTQPDSMADEAQIMMPAFAESGR